MKRGFLLCAVFFLCAPISRAALEWDDTEFTRKAELGQRASTFVFRFANTGDRPVQIRNIRSGCGCVVSKLKKKKYEAGEAGQLEVVFTFGSRTGRQEKWVRVETDDAQTPFYQLSFTVDIPPVAALEPADLKWRLDRTPLEAKTCIITFAEELRVELVRPVYDKDLLHVELEEVIKGRKYRVKVTPRDAGRTGSSAIILQASDNPRGIRLPRVNVYFQ